jgi:thiol-disulfide isomerase/thioredoxin
MNAGGIDLSTATIQLKDAEFQKLYPRAGAGEIEGLEGNQLSMSFAVQSDAKSKTGRELSGEYVLAAKEAMRFGGRWLINGELRLFRVPPGVVDDALNDKLRFENYVAEYDALPPGTLAPDIEFVHIDNEQKGKLSDLRGKVVILDIWATWCGPCQEPMAKLQKYQEENPGWENRVAVASLSIDDTLKEVRDHLDKRGWTNTVNLWAGEGGWKSSPAKAFRVSGVPTCYVIDADGKVIQGSHFVDAPRIVNELLK